tara:strand:- start:1724 stop:2110 length:387 start_codon:yes stop_codon:yes gene_type:complete
MANNTFKFNPDAGVAYGANLVINRGSTFKSTFQANNLSSASFDFSGYTMFGRINKSISIGASFGPNTTTQLTIGITSAADGQFNVGISSSISQNLKPGRYFYEVTAVSSASTYFKMLSGNIIVEGGIL